LKALQTNISLHKRSCRYEDIHKNQILVQKSKKRATLSGNLFVTNNLTCSRVFRVMDMAHPVAVLKVQQSDGGNLGAFNLLTTLSSTLLLLD